MKKDRLITKKLGGHPPKVQNLRRKLISDGENLLIWGRKRNSLEDCKDKSKSTSIASKQFRHLDR